MSDIQFCSTLLAHTRCHLDLQALADLEVASESTSLATAVQVEGLKFEPSADSDLCCASDTRRAFSVSGVQWVWSERLPFFRGLAEDVALDDDAISYVAKGYFKVCCTATCCRPSAYVNQSEHL